MASKHDFFQDLLSRGLNEQPQRKGCFHNAVKRHVTEENVFIIQSLYITAERGQRKLFLCDGGTPPHRVFAQTPLKEKAGVINPLLFVA